MYCCSFISQCPGPHLAYYGHNKCAGRVPTGKPLRARNAFAISASWPPQEQPQTRHVSRGGVFAGWGDLPAQPERAPSRYRGHLGLSASPWRLVLISMQSKQTPVREKQILCPSQTFNMDSKDYMGSYCVLSASHVRIMNYITSILWMKKLRHRGTRHEFQDECWFCQELNFQQITSLLGFSSLVYEQHQLTLVERLLCSRPTEPRL